MSDGKVAVVVVIAFIAGALAMWICTGENYRRVEAQVVELQKKVDLLSKPTRPVDVRAKLSPGNSGSLRG